MLRETDLQGFCLTDPEGSGRLPGHCEAEREVVVVDAFDLQIEVVSEGADVPQGHPFPARRHRRGAFEGPQSGGSDAEQPFGHDAAEESAFGGQMALLSRVIYALVGLAGLWCVTLLFRSSDEETGHAPHTA